MSKQEKPKKAINVRKMLAEMLTELDKTFEPILGKVKSTIEEAETYVNNIKKV